LMYTNEAPARTDYSDVTPDHLIDVTGMSKEEIILLIKLQVITIRQLASLSGFDCDLFPTMKRMNTPIRYAEAWGFCYVSDLALTQIVEEGALKSAYVLFQEYMTCSLEHREVHPWKQVYFQYRDEAKLKVKKTVPTDADVYSFLVWKGSQSLISFEVTAGPRAIYFAWTEMSDDLHEACLAADNTIDDSTNPYFVDRYAHKLAINLAKLSKLYQVKLYSIKKDDKWTSITTLEANSYNSDASLWEEHKAGNNLFSNMFHGCVVTSAGTIPIDCIKILSFSYICRNNSN